MFYYFLFLNISVVVLLYNNMYCTTVKTLRSKTRPTRKHTKTVLKPQIRFNFTDSFVVIKLTAATKVAAVAAAPAAAAGRS